MQSGSQPGQPYVTAKQNGHAFDVEAAGERHGDTVDGLTTYRQCIACAMGESIIVEQTSHSEQILTPA